MFINNIINATSWFVYIFNKFLFFKFSIKLFLFTLLIELISLFELLYELYSLLLISFFLPFEIKLFKLFPVLFEFPVCLFNCVKFEF